MDVQQRLTESPRRSKSVNGEPPKKTHAERKPAQSIFDQAYQRVMNKIVQP
jgi:hypothetical protein